MMPGWLASTPRRLAGVRYRIDRSVRVVKQEIDGTLAINPAQNKNLLFEFTE